MTRRALLMLPLAVRCRAADPAREVLDLVADAAASLSAGNVALFLKAFDPKMAGYAKLREHVTGLLAQGDVQSLIDPLEDEGDDRRRVAQFHWTLRLSLIHISEPTRLGMISYAVFCLKKKKKK